MIRTTASLWLLIAIFSLCSCARNIIKPPAGKPNPPDSTTAAATGSIYALVRGGSGIAGSGQDTINYNSAKLPPWSSATTLAYFDPATGKTALDRFSQVNDKTLGLGGVDMEVYGSKLYLVLAASQNVTVVDAHSTRLLGRTNVGSPAAGSGSASYPWSICFLGRSAYISLTSGSIAVMDTATLAITNYFSTPNLQPGSPAQVAVANGKLYVLSGSINAIQSLDPATGALIHTIPVYGNPLALTADAAGILYVQSQYDTANINFATFNFVGIIPGITVISSATDQVLYRTGFYWSTATPVSVAGNTGYYPGQSGSWIGRFNADYLLPGNIVDTFPLEPYTLAELDGLGQVTALTVDSASGQVLVGDSRPVKAVTGTVFSFGDNQLLFSFPAGNDIVKIVRLP